MLDFHLAHCIATCESKVSPTRTTLTSWSLELFACSMSPPPTTHTQPWHLEVLYYLPAQCPPTSPNTHTQPWHHEFRSLELFACSINYSRLHSLASHCLWVVETNHSSQYSTSLLSLFHINYCIHLYIGITNCLWYGIKGSSLMDTSSISEVK